MRQNLRRFLLLGIWCIPASGCTSWQRTHMAAGVNPSVSGKHPVRVTRAGKSTIVLRHARVQADSIIGEYGQDRHRVAVPLSDVRNIEEQRVSGTRTTVLLLAVVAVIAMVAYGASTMEFDLSGAGSSSF